MGGAAFAVWAIVLFLFAGAGLDRAGKVNFRPPQISAKNR
jgi:hypothetical protein